jgi:hypothetical protein
VAGIHARARVRVELRGIAGVGGVVILDALRERLRMGEGC